MIFPKVDKKPSISSVTSPIKRIVATVLAATSLTVLSATAVATPGELQGADAPLLMTQNHSIGSPSWHSSHSSHASHASHASHFSSRY